MEEEFQELDGLLEAAAGAAGGGERVGVGGEAERGHQLLLARGEEKLGGDGHIANLARNIKTGQTGGPDTGE
ncbi:hypothetical protein [Streptomyces sp. B21-101]|uniref:hypothetical protein n=1 Tax=Streptomyces sp. B21-101 TaxID=3039415 RepID=UPI002FF18742